MVLIKCGKYFFVIFLNINVLDILFKVIGIKFIELIDLMLYLGILRYINFEFWEGFYFYIKKLRFDNCYIF